MLRIAASVALVLTALHAHYPVNFEKPLYTIAFGSCNRQWEPQQVWDTIRAQEPDLFIALGDNVYVDSHEKIVPHITTKAETFKEVYDLQMTVPEYQKFHDSVPIIATWDDHDYGWNNGWSDFALKDVAQTTMLNFYEEPADSKRRKTPGVYAGYSFGPPEKQVDILLLDNRYFAEQPGADAKLLGDAQWAWLEEKLTTSTARLILIGSGTQVLPEEQPYEKWANYPKEREHLFELIKKATAPVILLSGDRHIHEISVKEDVTNYPLYEITSSGLNSAWKGFTSEPNKYRSGEVSKENGYGIIHIQWAHPNERVVMAIMDETNVASSIDETSIKALRMEPLVDPDSNKRKAYDYFTRGDYAVIYRVDERYSDDAKALDLRKLLTDSKIFKEGIIPYMEKWELRGRDFQEFTELYTKKADALKPSAGLGIYNGYIGVMYRGTTPINYFYPCIYKDHIFLQADMYVDGIVRGEGDFHSFLSKFDEAFRTSTESLSTLSPEEYDKDLVVNVMTGDRDKKWIAKQIEMLDAHK